MVSLLFAGSSLHLPQCQKRAGLRRPVVSRPGGKPRASSALTGPGTGRWMSSGGPSLRLLSNLHSVHAHSCDRSTQTATALVILQADPFRRIVDILHARGEVGRQQAV